MEKFSPEEDERQWSEWEALYGRISALLQQHGNPSAFTDGDYFLVDDNYGWRRHTVEVAKMDLFRPLIVETLRSYLDDHPSWEIVLAVSKSGKPRAFPSMGVTIRRNEIIDGLRRDLLPVFHDFHYKYSRPGTQYD